MSKSKSGHETDFVTKKIKGKTFPTAVRHGGASAEARREAKASANISPAILRRSGAGQLVDANKTIKP